MGVQNLWNFVATPPPKLPISKNHTNFGTHQKVNFFTFIKSTKIVFSNWEVDFITTFSHFWLNLYKLLILPELRTVLRTLFYLIGVITGWHFQLMGDILARFVNQICINTEMSEGVESGRECEAAGRAAAVLIIVDKMGFNTYSGILVL